MNDSVRLAYDRIAADYAREFEDEMARKPFDRLMLDWLIERVGALGPICDLGCGPGQVARYVARRGAETSGIDYSPLMVKEARRANPGIRFEVDDMRTLANVPDSSFGGIAAFYAIVNLVPEVIKRAFAAMHRVLRPRGLMLIAFHAGNEVLHKEEMWGRKVDLDFCFYRTPQVREWIATAGFSVEEAIERDPYPADIEYQSRRAYVFAQRP
jgi:SAM-dependent methyltransferase